MRRYRATHQITLFIYFISVFMRHIHQLKIGSAFCVQYVCAHKQSTIRLQHRIYCVSANFIIFYYFIFDITSALSPPATIHRL